MDFKTKNSNWSHFEGYESPIKEDEAAASSDEEETDLLWPNNTALSNDDKQQTPQRRNTNMNATANNSNSIQNRPQPPIHRRTSSIETIRNFNASIMPNKLILMRHGQSEGNVDEVLYSTIPDNNMRLTQLGWESARLAGRALREELGEDETVHFVVSPYVRTVETFHGIMSAWVDPREFDGLDGGRNRKLKAWYSKLMEMGELLFSSRLWLRNERTKHFVPNQF